MSRPLERRLIGELLRNPNTARIRYVERGFADAGHPAIRSAHLPILEYIDRDRGSRVSYLAFHANVTAQTMGELVSHLEAHGYAERVPDPTDGRAKLVRLTASGLELYALAGVQVRRLEEEWSRSLGDARFQELKLLLGQLWDGIERVER